MFREMRRKKQALDKKDVIEILSKRTAGTLAVCGDDGYPYAVPMSYVYMNDKIYMHSAKAGHKIDAIKSNDKVTFTVIDKDQIVAEEFTTYFRSVICFGRARILEEPSEILATLKTLTRKYSPNLEEQMDKEIESGMKHMHMIEIDIEHMTGKEALELTKMK